MNKPRRLPAFAQDSRRGSDAPIDRVTAATLQGSRLSLESSKASVSRIGPVVSDAEELSQGSGDSARDAEARPPLKLRKPGDNSAAPITAPVPGSSDLPTVLDEAHRVAAESFGILRSRLLSVHSRLGIRSVVITSAETGDGKTVVATNLALSLAELGAKRILLVDGDLRIGKVSQIFNLREALGVSDFLQGNATFGSILCPTELPCLAVAPSGTASKKVLSGLLQGPGWPEFIEKAKKEFDLIIVDTIPVSAPVVDLELLSDACDAVLLVVRMRQTNRQALKRAAARMDAKKFLGVVMNNADEVYEYDYGYLQAEK